jgi:putative acetyltransferase
MTWVVRLLDRDDLAAAADLHRVAGALIPGYDPTLHTPAEDRAFYRDTVFVEGPIWGVFEDDLLLGHIALKPGWIGHLYVVPERHGQGIGQRLMAVAKAEQTDLQLWTFQANVRARRFYEAAGFQAEELTDGAGNEEKMPDVRYRWRHA